MNTDSIKNITAKDVERFKMMKQLFSGSCASETRQITLKEFIDEYQEYCKQNLSEKTREGINTVNKKVLRHISPIRPVYTIGRTDAEKLVSSMRLTAPKGYRVYFRTLRAMFNKAKDWGYIKENPFTAIKLPKEQKLKPQYLKMEEFEKIYSSIQPSVVKDISAVCFLTGLRLSEGINLKWRNVDMDERLLTIGDKDFKTKTRRQRIVPMNEKVYELFEALKCNPTLLRYNEVKDRFVFAKTNGKMFTSDYISKQFKKACRMVGVDEGIHFHSLRHSAASNMVDKGVPIYSVQKILGHSSIATTQIYAHLDIDALREAVNTLQYKRKENDNV